MIEKQLKEETEKWLAKAREKRAKVKLLDKTKEDMLKNIDAYISDAQHFLSKGDIVKSFEAVIWSWAILEILEELEIISSQ